MRRAFLVMLVWSGCGKRPDHKSGVPIDSPHDETAHDENHYYLAVTTRGFEPSTLTVPLDKPLVLLVDRKRDAVCDSLIIDLGVGNKIERALPRDRPVEIHLELRRAGNHTLACRTSPLRGLLRAE